MPSVTDEIRIAEAALNLIEQRTAKAIADGERAAADLARVEERFEQMIARVQKAIDGAGSRLDEQRSGIRAFVEGELATMRAVMDGEKRAVNRERSKMHREFGSLLKLMPVDGQHQLEGCLQALSVADHEAGQAKTVADLKKVVKGVIAALLPLQDSEGPPQDSEEEVLTGA